MILEIPWVDFFAGGIWVCSAVWMEIPKFDSKGKTPVF